MQRSKRLAGIVLLSVMALGMFWYVEAGNFADGTVAGEDVSREGATTRRVWIKQDHTYAQEDTVNGIVMRNTGTWHGTTSTGRFWFSNNFIDTPDGVRAHDS